MAGAQELPVQATEPQRAAHGPWALALRRLLRKRLAVAGLVVIAVFYFVGLFAPLLAPQDYRDQDLERVFQGPSWDHPLGTDRLGRDQLTRLIWSSRTTIIITLATVFTGSLVLAVGLGMLSGYAGGATDTAIMRAGEAFASLPGLPMLILINATMRDRVRSAVDWLEEHLSTDTAAFLALLSVLSLLAVGALLAWLLARRSGAWLGLAFVSAGMLLVLWGLQAIFATPGAADYFLIFMALSLFSWVGGARVIRSQVLALRETEYVLAARGMGASTWRVLGSHLLPNVSPIIIVGVSASLGGIAGSEIALTFLGVGVHDPTPSFGAMIFEGAGLPVLRNHPQILLAPAFAVGAMIFAFNLLGDALNDVLTPRAR